MDQRAGFASAGAGNDEDVAARLDSVFLRVSERRRAHSGFVVGGCFFNTR